MIVFTTHSVLEFTTVAGRSGHMRVSAWSEGDIERAFPDAEVETVDPDIAEAKWRQYKAIVRREVVLDYLLMSVKAITYDSMYGHIMDARHRMMLEEWQSMWAEDSYQRWSRRTKGPTND